MRTWSRWIGVGAALGIILALVPVVRGSINLKDPLGKLQRHAFPELELPSLEGLDLQRLTFRPRRVVAPLKEGRIAELTLDPDVQRAALIQMKRYRIPEGGVV